MWLNSEVDTVVFLYFLNLWLYVDTLWFQYLVDSAVCFVCTLQQPRLFPCKRLIPQLGILFSPRDSRYYSVNPYLMVECLPETRAVVSLSREMTDSIIKKSKKVKLGQAVKKVYACVLSPLVPKVWNLSCQHRRFQFQLLAKIN